jgi:hypothetical protein
MKKEEFAEMMREKGYRCTRFFYRSDFEPMTDEEYEDDSDADGGQVLEFDMDLSLDELEADDVVFAELEEITN